MGLKPCPFCGGEAALKAMGWKCKDGKDRYVVQCTVCLTRQGYKALPAKQAAEAWNRRVGDDLMERMEDDGK